MNELIDAKERALHCAGHAGVERFVKGQITRAQMLNYRVKIAGVKKYTSKAHQDKIRMLSGTVQDTAALKQVFSWQQLFVTVFTEA